MFAFTHVCVCKYLFVFVVIFRIKINEITAVKLLIIVVQWKISNYSRLGLVVWFRIGMVMLGSDLTLLLVCILIVVLFVIVAAVINV